MADPPSIDEVVADDSLVAPFKHIDEDHAALIAYEHWGHKVGAARRLETERDDTFLLTSGDVRHVLKVAHPLDDPDIIDLQCSALAWAERRDETLPLPRLLPTFAGSPVAEVTGAAGEPRLARLLTFLRGDALEYDRTTSAQRFAIGVAHGRLSRALDGFEHPSSDRFLHYDQKQLGTLRRFLNHVEDSQVRADVARVVDDFDAHVGKSLAGTRQQVVHHDMNASNVLVDYDSAEFVTGILDFGDVVHSSVAGDLGAAMSYAVDAGVGEAADPGDVNPWDGPFDLAAGFHSIWPLTDDELALLPDLVKTRLAQRLILNSWLAASDPANAGYTGRTIARASRALHRVVSTPPPTVASRSGT